MAKMILIVGEYAERLAALLAPDFPTVAIAIARTRSDADAAAADADAIFALGQDLDDELLTAAARLDWIQALTTGTDRIFALAALRPGILVTSTRGSHGPQMSEMAFLHLLALTRDLPKMLANQRRGIWERWPQPLLEGKTIAIVGTGVIAVDLARRCGVFGMTVLGVSRAPRAVEGFDQVFPRERLADAAALADYVVVLVPLSPETAGIVDRRVLAAMKPTAFLVNLARGGVVDEQALLDALTDRRIAGAGLDVFSEEPLPPGHPFWALDNVLITPHAGGVSDVYTEQIIGLLRTNLRSYVAGDPGGMRNLVDREGSVAAGPPGGPLP